MASEILIYQTESQETRLEVRLEGDTVWLNQAQMAELFQTSIPNVNIHIKNVYSEGELEQGSTVKESLMVQNEANRSVERKIKLYNLDVIISVGYRVKSLQGTKFRIWATKLLREYLVKGFVLDDERLKEGRTATNYYREYVKFRAAKPDHKISEPEAAFAA